jgi:hypothetical protein
MKHLKLFNSFLNEDLEESQISKEMVKKLPEVTQKRLAQNIKGNSSLSKINEDWGSSDQGIMNKAIHKDMGNPSRFPSPFDDKLRSAAADAVDFWWDEWPEYKRDREGLIDNAIRAYYRAYFPKEFAGFTKMFSESIVNEKESLVFDILGPDLQGMGDSIKDLLQKTTDQKWITALKGIQTAWNNLEDKIAKADQKLGVITEGVVSIKGGRILANKVLNKLVDMDVIPVKKKTTELIEALASLLATASLDESVNEGSTISIPKLSDIDHTRIIKWMSNQFDSNTWNMKKSGSGFEIDVNKLSKAGQETLMNYLKSQSYINESKVNEAMVQVAGKSKPSGAQVLAMIIVDHLMERDFLKPGADRIKKDLVADLQKVIMDSTF